MVNPDNILDLFAKSVDVAGYAGPIPESLLSRQDLEAEIVKLTNRNTPLRDVTPRERGEGRAHLWNVRTALGGLPSNNNQLGIFYKDGALPVESDPQYVQKSAKPLTMWPSKTSLYRGTLPHACDMPIPRQPEKGALETIREASRKLSDEDEIVRPCRKRQEPGRNDLTLSSDRQQLAYAYLGVTGVVTGPMLKKILNLLASLNLAISVKLQGILGQYRANPLYAESA